MTDTEIIKTVSELDGFYCIDKGSPPWRFLKQNGEPAHSYILGDTTWFWTCQTPSYLTSRDAIIPVIEKQSSVCSNWFEYRLVQCLLESIPGMPKSGDLTFPMIYHLIVRSMPRQLCEALLRATEKWKD